VVDELAVWGALSTVMDPEIPFSVVDLGLVYGVFVEPSDEVRVQMTLTTRGCPLVRRISEDVEAAVKEQTGARSVTVELVWDPPWSPEMASESVRAHLGR
jgi:metal-sulfur cluster biosynthetic enzyme